MKKTIFIAVLTLSSAANATEVPAENVVKKALESASCSEDFDPTYKFTQLNPIHSYVLRDGKLILETYAASCPEGYHYTGSFCVEVLCTKPKTNEEE